MTKTDTADHRRELGQEVAVAGDEKALGDDADRVAELGEDLEALPGQLELPLGRLVAVADAAHAHELWVPAGQRQLMAEQRGRTLLDQDPRLEVQPAVPAKKFVEGARVAIGAAVLAAPVDIHADGKGNVGALVRREEGLRRVHVEFRARMGLLRRDPLKGLGPGIRLQVQALEPVGRADRRAPPGDRRGRRSAGRGGGDGGGTAWKTAYGNPPGGQPEPGFGRGGE